MQTLTDPLSTTFAALSDPTRRGILARLAKGEATVTELAAPYDLSLPAISKHLKVLQRAGLIEQGRQAQWRPCRLTPEPLRDVSDWLGQYRRHWEASFDRLDDYLQELQATTPATKRGPRGPRQRKEPTDDGSTTARQRPDDGLPGRPRARLRAGLRRPARPGLDRDHGSRPDHELVGSAWLYHDRRGDGPPDRWPLALHQPHDRAARTSRSTASTSRSMPPERIVRTFIVDIPGLRRHGRPRDPDARGPRRAHADDRAEPLPDARGSPDPARRRAWSAARSTRTTAWPRRSPGADPASTRSGPRRPASSRCGPRRVPGMWDTLLARLATVLLVL